MLNRSCMYVSNTLEARSQNLWLSLLARSNRTVYKPCVLCLPLVGTHQQILFEVQVRSCLKCFVCALNLHCNAIWISGLKLKAGTCFIVWSLCEPFCLERCLCAWGSGLVFSQKVYFYPNPTLKCNCLLTVGHKPYLTSVREHWLKTVKMFSLMR